MIFFTFSLLRLGVDILHDTVRRTLYVIEKLIQMDLAII